MKYNWGTVLLEKSDKMEFTHDGQAFHLGWVVGRSGEGVQLNPKNMSADIAETTQSVCILMGVCILGVA